MLPEGVNDVADKVKMRKGIDEIRVHNERAGLTASVKRAFRQGDRRYFFNPEYPYRTILAGHQIPVCL